MRTIKAIAMILLAVALTAPAKARVVSELGADWVKLDDGVWLGAHCQIVGGDTKNLLKDLTKGIGGTILNLLKVGVLVEKAIDKITLARGDAYCVYMLRTERGGRDFDRRELLGRPFARGEPVRLASIWHLATFDGGEKAARRDSDRCYNQKEDRPRSRCLTHVLKGNEDGQPNEKTKGFAACFQIELKGGKMKSAVMAWGAVPSKIRMETRTPEVKDVPCRQREPEFLG